MQRLNLYTCQECGGKIVTVDLVQGVTPFMIACRVDPGDARIWQNEDRLSVDELRKAAEGLKCRGDMYSSFYRVPLNAPAPTWEWYKPEAAEYATLPKATKEDHVDRGGLLIRPRAKP